MRGFEIFFVDTIVGAEESTKGVAGSQSATLDDITFKASYKADAGLPEGTKLVVKAVDADDYSDATKDALGDVEIVEEKYFDISFEYDGEEIEPKADVDVKITLSGDERMTAGNDVKVVHFEDGKDKKPEVLDADVTGGKKAESSNLLKKSAKSLAPKKTESGSDSVVTFKSDSFSVYGVVETEDDSKTKNYRRTYTFQNDDGNAYNFSLTKNPAAANNDTPVATTTNQQIVKNGGQLLDVGIPVSTVDSKKEFLGWGVVTGEGESVTVDTDNLITLPYNVTGLTGDDSVTLRAVYSDQIKITFYDVDNTTILNTVKATPGSTLDLGQYEAVPASSEQGFLGWSTEKSQTSGALDSRYTVPKSDTNLYPVVASGHWLRFDKNDSDNDPTEATYTSPVFVTGEVTSEDKPTDPTRTGYTFAGWYENKEGTGDQYSFSGTLSESKTLYAKWTPNEVKYKIVYWQENPDDYGFSYVESEDATGTAGTKTSTSGIANKYSGFHLHNSTETDRTDETHISHVTEEAVIKGDGTTVVNVYYDRDIYKIYFVNSSSEQSLYTENSSGDYYYFPGGYIRSDDYYYEYRYTAYDAGYYKVGEGPWSSTTTNGTYVTYYTRNGSNRPGQGGGNNYSSHNYSFTRYALNSGTPTDTIDELTITAKYGADIASKWPSRRTDLTTDYPVNWKVSPSGNQYQANISTMPLNGAIYYYSSEEDENYLMEAHYYTQDVDGGDNFTIDHTDQFPTTNYNKWSTTEDDYYDLRGFTVIFNSESDAGDVENYVLRSDVSGVTSSHSSDKVGSSFSYERNDGNYYSNKYVYSVSFYYARNRYEIDFTPNDGNNRADITSSYYYQASIANAAPSSYVKGQTTVTASNGDTLTFAGWYDNPDGLGDEYIFTGKTMPANNIHLYGKWTPTTYTFTADPNGGTFTDKTTANKVIENVPFGTVISEDDYRNPTCEGYEFIGWYIKNADGTESIYDFASPVKGDVYLIAHWKKTGSFGVKYINTNEPAGIDGDQLKVDSNVYADQAEVKVLEAPTNSQIPTGYEFIGWSYNGKNYVPGDTITLDAANATTGTDTINVNEKNVNYITLKAQYTKLNTTWLKYDANGGSGNLDGLTNNQQVDIPMNTQVTLSSGSGFTRSGYVLVGWNSDQTKADNGEVEWNVSEKVGVDGVEGNTLYAVWKQVYVEVEFTKKGGKDVTTATALSGAQFKLSNGTTDKTQTSDDNGSVSFIKDNAVLAPTIANGTITLTETSAPAGYKAPTQGWNITYDVTKATQKYSNDDKYYVTGTVEGLTNNTIINEPDTKNIIIEKIDASDATKKLTGAEFKLTYGSPENNATAESGIADGKVTFGNNSSVTIEGLSVGEYTLTETKAPDGYIIDTTGKALSVSTNGVTYDGKSVIANADGSYTIQVTNKAGEALPNTGGSGTWTYTASGLALIAMAVLMRGITLKKEKG